MYIKKDQLPFGLFIIYHFHSFYIEIIIYYPPDDAWDKYVGSDSMYKLSTISFTSFSCYHFKQLTAIIIILPGHPLITRLRFSHFITPIIICHPRLISIPLIHLITLLSPRLRTRINLLTSIAIPSLLL